MVPRSDGVRLTDAGEQLLGFGSCWPRNQSGVGLGDPGGPSLSRGRAVGLPVGDKPGHELGCGCSGWSSSGFGGLAVLCNE